MSEFDTASCETVEVGCQNEGAIAGCAIASCAICDTGSSEDCASYTIAHWQCEED